MFLQHSLSFGSLYCNGTSSLIPRNTGFENVYIYIYIRSWCKCEYPDSQGEKIACLCIYINEVEFDNYHISTVESGLDIIVG